MIPHRQPSDGAQLFQAVSNEGETDKPLMGVMKPPAGSLFHDFGEHRLRNFNRDRSADLNIPSGLPLKTAKRRNRRIILKQYQPFVCFSRFETA